MAVFEIRLRMRDTYKSICLHTAWITYLCGHRAHCLFLFPPWAIFTHFSHFLLYISQILFYPSAVCVLAPYCIFVALVLWKVFLFIHIFKMAQWFIMHNARYIKLLGVFELQKDWSSAACFSMPEQEVSGLSPILHLINGKSREQIS